MMNIISGHNSKVSNATKPLSTTKPCNCLKKNPCPLSGECLSTNVVYQATVNQTQTDIEENYVGLTADPFKLRFGNHKKSFKHENYSSESTLSSYIWKLKSENINYNISWKIIDRGKSFSPITNICQLCTKEKFHIIFHPELSSLNSRNELFSSCRHKMKQLLKNI